MQYFVVKTKTKTAVTPQSEELATSKCNNCDVFLACPKLVSQKASSWHNGDQLARSLLYIITIQYFCQ
jgi:hypothetical protein